MGVRIKYFNTRKLNFLSVQTFAKCFLKRTEFLDEAGNFNPDVALEKLTLILGDKAKAEEAVKECQATDTTDKDAFPLAIYKCYIHQKSLKQHTHA